MFRDRPVIEATSSPSGEFPSRTRSAVTNHKDLLPGLDGRSATARRFRDLVNAFVADMGGLDHCSEIKLGLVGSASSVRARQPAYSELDFVARQHAPAFDLGLVGGLGEPAQQIAFSRAASRGSAKVSRRKTSLPLWSAISFAVFRASSAGRRFRSKAHLLLSSARRREWRT